MNTKKPILYNTFQAFRPHFDALARVAYYKVVLKPLSRTKESLHYAYRVITWIIVLTYNLQHLIRVILVRHSTDQMVDTLFILLTTLNTLGKQVTFNGRSQRVEHIIDIIDGPYFAPTKLYHVAVMKSNENLMSRLLTLYHGAIFTCGCLWTIFPLVNRALGEEVQFTGYFPFDTNKSPAFELTIAYMTIVITFQAYGNVTMDCTIASFYSQAKTQIQMLRHNLEHLADLDGGDDVTINAKSIRRNNQVSYIDNGDERIKLQTRLTHCVNHYQQIVWFTKEIESVFDEAMIIQFFVSAWVICMTVYKIVGLNIISAEFVSMAVYLGCILAQLFIYCYFGTQLEVECKFINQSVYCSDWMFLSPKFRRQLLIKMQYCSRPLAPRTAYIIPMSLDTYIAVLKSSYTLFTFLNRK